MSGYDTDDDRIDDRDNYHNPNPRESGKWISALIALLGLWMIGEALLLDLAMGQFWNDILVGALLLAAGGYNYTQRADEEAGSIAAAGLTALLGIWLIAAPFVLGAGAEGAAVETMNDFGFWNDVVVGLLALVLGAYSAYKARELRARVSRTEAAR